MVDVSAAMVLIIDDDPVILQLAARSLRGLCQVKVAPKPSVVLGMVDRFVPDLILLDVNLPEMSGYALLEQLHQGGSWSEVPVIFLTARAEAQDEERGLRLGAVDYVTKPLNPNTLQMRVKVQLQLQLALRRESAARLRADELLEVILPRRVAQELRVRGEITPQGHEDVAVLFCDVTDFTAFCSTHPAEEVVARLDRLFTRYEEIVDRWGVEKTKTIGDCFMATSGLDPEAEAQHAHSPLFRAISAALEMCLVTREAVPDWKVRAGVFSGPLVSGVVGEQRFQFDVWGDSVNVAARLCGASGPESVAVTGAHWAQFEEERRSSGAEALRVTGQSLGRVYLKGLGEIEVYELRAVMDTSTVHEEPSVR